MSVINTKYNKANIQQYKDDFIKHKAQLSTINHSSLRLSLIISFPTRTMCRAWNVSLNSPLHKNINSYKTRVVSTQPRELTKYLMPDLMKLIYLKLSVIIVYPWDCNSHEVT